MSELPNTVIALHGVDHQFVDRTGVVSPALAQIHFELPLGGFVTLVGPSGCGKSTLLRLLAGLEPVQVGKRHWPANLSLAYVFQDACLLPWLSVEENIALPLEIKGISRSEVRQRVSESMGLVELSGLEGKKPRQLSGGMRMRVSIARALAVKPHVLLMDEPFGALDEITRQRLDDRLRLLWSAQKLTVIFVTHSVFEAVYLADRICLMSKTPGRIVLDTNVQLPVERDKHVRTSAAFMGELRRVTQALEEVNP